MSEKFRFMKVTRPREGGHYAAEMPMAEEELRVHIEEGEVGEVVSFEVVEMTLEEYDALPEFDGW